MSSCVRALAARVSQRAVQFVSTEEGVGIGEKNALIARQSLFPPAGEGGRERMCVCERDRQEMR